MHQFNDGQIQVQYLNALFLSFKTSYTLSICIHILKTGQILIN